MNSEQIGLTNERDHLSALRELICAQYGIEGEYGDFGTLLCGELHRRDSDFPDGMTFAWLAEKWGISLSLLGELIADHCRRLEPLPKVNHGYSRD